MTTPEIVIDGQPEWVPMQIALLTDTRITTTARVIFGVLLWHGQTPERCFPGHARVGELVGIEPRSVARPMNELETAGWISRHRRFDQHGHRTSDGYTLHVNARKASSVPSAQSSASLARVRARPKRAPKRDEHHQEEREQEEQIRAHKPPVTAPAPQLTLVAEDGDRGRDIVADEFEDWWLAYAGGKRKIRKKLALAAWRRAVKRLGGWSKAETVLVEGTQRWNDHWHRERTLAQHIPHPTTWLNGEDYKATPVAEKARAR